MLRLAVLISSCPASPPSRKAIASTPPSTVAFEVDFGDVISGDMPVKAADMTLDFDRPTTAG